MKNIKEKPKNLATPGRAMTQDAFKAMIKEAENGEFLTESEFKSKIEESKLSRKK